MHFHDHFDLTTSTHNSMVPVSIVMECLILFTSFSSQQPCEWRRYCLHITDMARETENLGGCLNISGRFQSWMLTQSNPSYHTPDCLDTAVYTCLCTLGPGATTSRKFTCSDISPLAPSTQGSMWSGFLFNPSLWAPKLCQTLNVGQAVSKNWLSCIYWALSFERTS